MTYDRLLQSGWRMKEIDECDLLGFLHVRAWSLKRAQSKKPPVKKIDEIWPVGKAGGAAMFGA